MQSVALSGQPDQIEIHKPPQTQVGTTARMTLREMFCVGLIVEPCELCECTRFSYINYICITQQCDFFLWKSLSALRLVTCYTMSGVMMKVEVHSLWSQHMGSCYQFVQTG